MVSRTFLPLRIAVCLLSFLLFSYLHGYMDGEAFSGVHGNKTELKEFVIV